MRASGSSVEAAPGGVRSGSVRGEAHRPGQDTWRIVLSYTRPPLTLNQRLHWSHRAKITTQIHDEFGPQIHALKVPALTFPTLTLHYVPRDRRGRDVDNLVPTSKACCDALKVHGVISDDTHLDVDHRMPVIHAADRNASPRLWFEVMSRD